MPCNNRLRQLHSGTSAHHGAAPGRPPTRNVAGSGASCYLPVIIVSSATAPLQTGNQLHIVFFESRYVRKTLSKTQHSLHSYGYPQQHYPNAAREPAHPRAWAEELAMYTARTQKCAA